MKNARVYSSVVANGLSRVLIGILNIAVVPLYMKYLGMEAYGLVGFFAIVQSFVTVFDLGISSALTRSLSHNLPNVSLRQKSRDLSRTLEVFYWGISAVIGLSIAVFSPLIASHWIKRVAISESQLHLCLWLMATALLFQFPFSFYTAGLVGLQRQIEQSALNLLFWVVRSLGVIPFILQADDRLSSFFFWQASVSLLSVIIVRHAFWHYMPRADAKTRFSLHSISSVWKFAISVSAFSILLLIFNNIDKIYLSGKLSLDQYGYYVTAWQVATVLYLFYMPVYTVFYPVFVQLHSSENRQSFVQEFRKANLMVSLLITPTVAIIVVFAPEILLMWTRKQDVAVHAAPIVRLFMPGAFSGAFFYLLWAVSQARGDVHRLVNFPFVSIVLLSVIVPFSFTYFGSQGVAASWMIVSVTLNFSMAFYVFCTSLKLEALSWLFKTIFTPSIVCGLIVFLARFIIPDTLGNFGFLAALTATWAVCVACIYVVCHLQSRLAVTAENHG